MWLLSNISERGVKMNLILTLLVGLVLVPYIMTCTFRIYTTISVSGSFENMKSVFLSPFKDKATRKLFYFIQILILILLLFAVVKALV